MKSGWTIKKLGEVCEEVKDRISSAEVVLSAYITTDNMLKDCAGVCEAENLPPRVTSLVKYRKGDILLSNIRPYLKKVWLSDRDGAASSDVIVFRVCSKEIYPRYFWRALARDEFFDYSMLNVSGTKMPRGKKEWIKQFEIPVPPLAEQKRIVAKIDAAFEKINKLKANAERNLANAKELFQSALDEAMRQKKDWVEKRLGEVYNFIDYRGKTPNKINEGVPLVTARNIRMGYLDYAVRDYISQAEYKTRQSRGIAHKGDILFTTEAPLGFVALADLDEFSTGQRVITFQQHKGSSLHLLNKFYFYYFQANGFQSEIRKQATGATAQGIKASRLREIPIAVVPYAEQQQVVKRLDILAEKTELLQQRYTQQIADCAEMRQSVLREAFEGRL